MDSSLWSQVLTGLLGGGEPDMVKRKNPIPEDQLPISAQIYGAGSSIPGGLAGGGKLNVNAGNLGLSFGGTGMRSKGKSKVGLTDFGLNYNLSPDASIFADFSRKKRVDPIYGINNMQSLMGNVAPPVDTRYLFGFRRRF